MAHPAENRLSRSPAPGQDAMPDGSETGQVTITNSGADAVNGWTLEFAFPGDQKVSQGWSATWSQSGDDVTATSMAWNGALAPDASQTIGFQATGASSGAPAEFDLNDQLCEA